MQRYILTLDTIPYLIEYFTANESNIKMLDNFVMLRKYEMLNDIAQDKEIMFISLEDYIKIFDENSKENNNLVYPSINKDYETYVDSILKYLPDSNVHLLRYLDIDNDNSDLNKDYYNILRESKTGEFKLYSCECDKIRIYIPHNRKPLDSIISVSNYINEIHFNYFCKKFSDEEIKIGKEIKYGNNIYYEYIEFYIPSLESLFINGDAFYNEDINILQTKFYNKEFAKNQHVIYNSDTHKTPIELLIMPYTIEKYCQRNIECDDCIFYKECEFQEYKNLNVKTYYTTDLKSKEYLNSEFNINNIPTILTLTHYDTIDNESRKFFSSVGISPSSVIMSKHNEFSIKARIGFDRYNKSIISVISEFEYPKINNMSVQESYFYFNKVTDTEAYWNFNENDYDFDMFFESLSDELIESIKFNSAGYVIEMSLDNKFTEVFYRYAIGAKEIDDFTFAINDIFSDWKEYPEIIFIRTLFIDKPLCKIIQSNLVVLTKEQFKYCINDTGIHRINLNEIDDMIFLNNINCSVRKFDISNENIKINRTTDNYRILYKTIFFKTYDLQNIKLRDNVSQTIGINLQEYFSKVSEFKLKIDGYEFVESGRNEIYVLFTIPASQISTKSGKYDIVDGLDDTYISSGNYTIS